MAYARICFLACVLLAMLMATTADFVDSDDQEKFEDAEETAPSYPSSDLIGGAGVPVFVPFPDSSDVEESQYYFPAPLKRRYYGRADIFKRSRLNRLIQRLLMMRGDRYSYHRASPVRFAAGRR